MENEQIEQPPTEENLSASSARSAPSAFENELDDLRVQLDDLRAQNDGFRTQLRLRSARDTLVSALAVEQARSPELLFDASVNSFEFDGEGVLTNAAHVIAELRQKFPEQFVTEEAVAPPPIPPVHAGAGRDLPIQSLTREALAGMTPQEIALLDWNDVKHVLTH